MTSVGECLTRLRQPVTGSVWVRWPIRREWGRAYYWAAALLIAPRVLLSAQQPMSASVTTTLVKPGVYVLSQEAANMILYVTEEGTVIAGVQAPALVAEAKVLVKALNAPPVRYVLAMEDKHSATYEDGGWRRAGATTFAHELHYVRMRKAMSDTALGALDSARDLPLIGFSRVMQLFLKGAETHWVHERNGYTDADVIVHLEKPGVVYLGNTFTNDGYPEIDIAKGGSIDGIIDTAQFFVVSFATLPDKVEPIVPGRGPLATLKELGEYRDMLVATRDTVRVLAKLGKSVDEIVAALPTRAFDARWGHAAISPGRYVRAIYASLQRK